MRCSGFSGCEQRKCAADQTLRGDDRQPVSHACVRALERMRREFDDRKRTQPPGDSPGGHGRPHFQHLAVTRDEQQVDRELHEKGVHDAGGCEDERVVVRQTRPSEQPPVTRCRLGGELEGARDNQACALVPQREALFGRSKQRLEKVRRLTRLQSGSGAMTGRRKRYFTGLPSRTAGLNFQALAAATSIRSWYRFRGEINRTNCTSPASSTTRSK